jgi:hypothetical protein
VVRGSGSYIEPLSELDSLVFSETQIRQERSEANVLSHNIGLVKNWIMALFKEDDKVKLLNDFGLAGFIANINSRQEDKEDNDKAHINSTIKELTARI